MIKLFNKDYNECEDVKFDLIFTDIPYNIGTDAYASNPQWWKDGKIANGYSEKANAQFFEKDIDFNVYNWMLWCANHLKENGKLITFCSIEQVAEIIRFYKKCFKKYTPLVFIKKSSSEVLKVNMRIVGACEYGIVLYKNKLGKFNNDGKMIKNWFCFDRVNNKQHPNQKPLQLCKDILKLYVESGDLVCDTCMGSGVIVKACQELGIDCYGFEIEKKYFDIASTYIFKGED